jgi:hypothetical protein
MPASDNATPKIKCRPFSRRTAAPSLLRIARRLALPVPDWTFCAAASGDLAVPAGETAALPWIHDRMEQPAARAAAARHSAGVGAGLPVR